MGNRQQGAALIIAMLIMILLTGIGMSLMRASSQDLKMAGAAAEKKMISNMLEGAIDETLSQTSMSTTLSNLESDISFSSSAFDDTSGTISDRGEFDCKRSHNASSTNVMTSCKYADVILNSRYGKGDIAQLTVSAGVEQGIINGQ